MSLVIGRDQIDKIIEREKPKRVGLEAPDGLLDHLLRLSQEITKKHGVETVVLLDNTWGTCDLVNFDVKRLGVDLVFNIGHSIGVEKLGRHTYLIDAEYRADFRPVLDRAVELLRKSGYSSVGVVTISNHKSQLDAAIEYLRQKGIEAQKGEAEGPLFDGQVFGCNFHSARKIIGDVQAFLFMGQSRFHSLGVCLSTRKPTFMLDPFFNEVVNIAPEAALFEKKAILSIYKARDARSFGIIMSLKEGQLFRKQALELKQELEKLGKVVQLFSLREITAQRLKALRGIDAFIETACPRVSMDNYDFDRPVLSYQQGMGLVRLFKGQEMGDVFDYSFWV
ncbi:MAG: diphthamide biosynthesis enzyme Dph2 [Nitrososphaerota archaeon]|nr:diphthamide biosynthesis enzyme Dph2 [Nitrososphaerota archaeon]